jgi:FSR family fosmidomycin resistance protein-like MFS transporter
MSLFAVGGNLGFACGPLVAAPLVLLLGLPGTLLLAAPAALVALLLQRELPRLRRSRVRVSAARHAEPHEPDLWRPFWRLALLITLRSVVYFGLVTFVPIYFVHQLGASDGEASAVLTAMLFAGAVGTLIGGRLADRLGRRRLLVLSLAPITPLLLAFLASGPLLAAAVLALVGGLVIATFSVTVVMGQEYLPNRIGIASGVTLGAAIGMGGVSASVLGVLADHVGLSPTLDLVAVLPLAVLALAFTLPERVRPLARR